MRTKTKMLILKKKKKCSFLKLIVLYIKIYADREFPCGLVVRISGLSLPRTGFSPWSEKIPQAMWCGQKVKVKPMFNATRYITTGREKIYIDDMIYTKKPQINQMKHQNY